MLTAFASKVVPSTASKRCECANKHQHHAEATPPARGDLRRHVHCVHTGRTALNCSWRCFSQENAERTVFDGLVSFFDDYHSNEDVFVVFNQDISDQTKQPNPTWKELDAIVINSTKGYILVIEAKAKLTPKK